ncbi:helix-turn-helix domain-containing protein [Methylobacterium oryzisoli]|uniref:helix-turn-helix domain-containing protein n=1 Tax=Methylobacterium oryzisoli TaxID=3385502 RepID=UPI003891E1ED
MGAVTLDIEDIAEHYAAISRHVPLRPIRTSEEYDSAVTALDALLDQGAAQAGHALAGLVATLGELIADYDDTHHRLPDAGATEVLRMLMEAHGIRQADLPEVGSQGVVSEVLSGQRELNVRQIKALAQRFGVSPAVFL